MEKSAGGGGAFSPAPVARSIRTVLFQRLSREHVAAPTPSLRSPLVKGLAPPRAHAPGRLWAHCGTGDRRQQSARFKTADMACGKPHRIIPGFERSAASCTSFICFLGLLQNNRQEGFLCKSQGGGLNSQAMARYEGKQDLNGAMKIGTEIEKKCKSD